MVVQSTVDSGIVANQHTRQLRTWRAEAYVDKGPKASDAAADRTGKWQQANTQDRAVEETPDSLPIPTVCITHVPNKEEYKNVVDVFIDYLHLNGVGGEVVDEEQQHEADLLDRHTGDVPDAFPEVILDFY